MYALDLGNVRLEPTADDSGTELRLVIDQADGVARLSVEDAQDLARGLLDWLVANGHELPELPDPELT
jgi:hypothetical protein